ncbi:hypothetical protein [Pseudoxanthomonas mexicana]|uniref:hypothetical protein n=1 Tax=Pseudoxanthomonas mexicana TaxID=128785 RepID=UPI000785E134|nr:hypothetical protein [Pseudoxanthomonas mexicana]
MSILILRGPHAGAAAGSPPHFASTDHDLRLRAHSAGHALHCRAFDSLRDLLPRLRQVRQVRRQDGMVLIDAGDLAVDSPDDAHALRDALDALPVPYIELHDDAAHALEPRVQPQHPPLVTVILRDDLPHAYTMALAIALRRVDHPEPTAPLHA